MPAVPSGVTSFTMSPPSAPARNRLAREKSPYLLQHAGNPVDWYPWGEEAFARARAEDRPIFLSIGYSTCHWCHVMERESFEHPDVAELLNAHFVPVKVDREERPDVDRLYMTSAQAMGVGGGWPLNLFLTPDLEPFWGGTYFPPSSRGGRPGMMELLPRLHAAWLEQREEIVRGGRRVLEAVDALATSEHAPESHAALARECAAWLARMHDPAHGGFGDAPKFPSPGNLSFLFRWWAGAPDARAEALAHALAQLDAMRAGGIHDHLGGGFHRYSTDREWLVPHFEKMLYDQALLADAYLDGWEITRRPEFEATARGVFDYVRRDLLVAGAAFASAEDADSEGEEGRFYVWTPEQAGEALGSDPGAELALAHWGVTPRGNFEHGASILHERRPLAETARAMGLDEPQAREALERARVTLLAARSARVRPLRDDKVITAWNALMIASFARGGRVLRDAGLTATAVAAAEFVWRELRDPATGGLRRRWRDGEAAGEGQLDDHAYFARACLELFQATQAPHWLERAAHLTDAQIARFWDDTHGAFYESPAGDPHVRVRMKDGFDGAELAGNSVAAENLVRLAGLLPEERWAVHAERTLAYHARRLAGGSWAMPRLLVAMERAGRPARHVVIAGEPSPAREALLEVFGSRFRAFEDLLVVEDATRGALAGLVPFAAALAPQGGRATAYVCENRACRLPVTEPRAFAEQLDPDGAPGGRGGHA
jgi:uncharacterized protein YyaL (SSP411 family)